MLYVALDTKDAEWVIGFTKSLPENVGIKVGLELFTALGPDFVLKLKEYGRSIFLDLKLHDIPTTVGKTVQSLRKISPDMLTIHSVGGSDMMKAAKDNASFPIIAVSMLSSQDYNSNYKFNDTIDEIIQCNLDGFVCPPSKIGDTHVKSISCIKVVPGIRPSWYKISDDHFITLTPKEAIECGATDIVIGRPITASDDPLLSVNKIIREIEHDSH
ncbi:MAG: orotidine-5'-phosphate decarboxylase [Candidimonas sp.]